MGTSPKRVIGLTGGIGAGKSTVAALLAELGATIVDCDELGRLVVTPDGRAYQDVVAAFGPEIVHPDGQLDRARLGAIVFADAQALGRLNAITHPAIDQEITAAIDAAPSEPVVLDMAVLTESDLGAGQYQRVLVVEAPLEQRLDRLRSTRGMTDEQSMARIDSQATTEQRRAGADDIIVNDGTEQELRTAIEAYWTRSGFG